jgi:diacylglycerol kinase (ATP)
MKPSSWLESVNCAIEGILWSVKSQRHMRYHFVAAAFVLLIALFFHVSALEFLLLTFAVILVIFAELVNTAFEVVVDLVSPDFHLLARRAKDVAAGAVLVTSVGALIAGYLVLSRYIFPGIGGDFSGLGPPRGELSVVSVLVVTILVVFIKACTGKGTPLHGGMPSGHAAIAFSIATSVALSSVGALTTLLAVVLATMVCHSRLLLKIHTLREVLVGVLLGVVVTLILHLLFA